MPHAAQHFLFFDGFHYPDTMWTLPQIQWVINNEPEVAKKVKRVLFAKDYLRYRLCPVYCTDHIDALGSMFLDAETNEWDPELCALIGFKVEDMPKIVKPTDIVGHVCEEMAARTGLSRDTLVVAGASDTALEVFAAGAVRPGQMTVKMATAGRICVSVLAGCCGNDRRKSGRRRRYIQRQGKQAVRGNQSRNQLHLRYVG